MRMDPEVDDTVERGGWVEGSIGEQSRAIKDGSDHV